LSKAKLKARSEASRRKISIMILTQSLASLFLRRFAHFFLAKLKLIFFLVKNHSRINIGLGLEAAEFCDARMSKYLRQC
jgi:hypothetical protein